jgi:hypothetical protein
MSANDAWRTSADFDDVRSQVRLGAKRTLTASPGISPFDPLGDIGDVQFFAAQILTLTHFARRETLCKLLPGGVIGIA